MKKAMLGVATLVVATALIAVFCTPAVAGQPCSNCHTMHASQSPWDARWDAQENLPNPLLLARSGSSACAGCHSSSNPGDVTDPVTGAPIIYTRSPSAPTFAEKGLAAGNFHYCNVEGESTRGHNLSATSLSGQGDDTNLKGKGPPGFKEASIPTGFTQRGTGWGPTAWASAQGATRVTCGGEYGCHGDRSTGYDDYNGLYGAHHKNSSTITGEKVGTSYRFLAGIFGDEDTDWEKSRSSTDHNAYQGDAVYNSTNTISYLCAQCRGKFHGKLAASLT